MAKPLTITRYDGTKQTWENLNPITVGQNVYGSGDNATTPLFDNSDQINPAFLSNYVDKSSAQTISGAKTFTDKIVIGDGTNSADIKMDSSQRIAFYFSNNPKMKIGQLDTLFANRVTPDTSATYDLGRSGVYWRDLYLSGQIKNASCSFTLPSATGTLAITDDIPTNYLKSASVSNNTLTLTKQDNSTVTFTSGNSGNGGTNNYSIAYNLVVNSNGYQYNGYKFANVTISGLNYTTKQFQVSTTSVKVTDTSIIKAYLKVMTGRDRLPEYDEDCPINDFIICTSNNTMWKMQYDSTNGLLAIRVDNSPFANSVQTITLASTQIVSQTPLAVSLTEAQQSVVENLKNTIIKIDISAFYTTIGLDSPYAWIKRNAIKNIGDTTNGAVLYEFICNNNDIDVSANLTKLGNIGVYYFYQTVGTYSTYNKKIIISSAKITLSNLSHATNLQNSTGSGSLLQVPITSTFTFSNDGSEQSGTKNTAATAVDATSLGGISLASGDSSFASGKNNVAAGWASAAFGNNTYSGGDKTFTEGTETTATGGNAHAAGQGTIASGGNQFVIGRWNSSNTTDLFIIGNGSSHSSRSNALSVSQEGYLKCVGLTDGTTQKTMSQILAGGGSSGSSGIPYVDSKTSGTQSSPHEQQQDANKFYDYGERGYDTSENMLSGSDNQVSITNNSGTNGIVNEYSGQILADENDVTLTTPSNIIWSQCEGVENNNNVLTLEKNYTYQFSIINNLGLIIRWANGTLDKPTVSFSYPNLSWTSVTDADDYIYRVQDATGIDIQSNHQTTSTSANISSIKPQTQLSTPTNVSASPSATSIVVTYSSVSNANQYTIYYKTSSASSYSSTTSTSTSKTISGLSSNTNYSVYVVANNTASTVLNATVRARAKKYVDATSDIASCSYYKYTNSSGSTPTTVLTKLSTPTPSISGSTISWSSISGATYYVITTSDGHTSSNIVSTSYDLSNWYSSGSGTVTVYVTAYSGSNSSATSTGVSYSYSDEVQLTE